MKNLLLTSLVVLFIGSVGVAQTGQILGRVNDREGKAAAFVNIQLVETAQGVLSDRDGKFALTDLNAGTYTLIASYIGYRTLNQKITKRVKIPTST
ncbi:carboxypeptidase-like regulatory domain-containing protein [Haliscomenobacter sp.]|uniref:carboxypeptidase-like regulatory domain-containing protein n=1 Tax=Haliscomenobacter sp. TaxID=2717303 RepID=UPI003364ECAF